MSEPVRSSATIKDVALACGVSEAAVSYAINGKKGVNPKTRERVFQAMQELNYHPSAVARGLAKKRVHILGVLFGQVAPSLCLSDQYMVGVLSGVMAHAEREGFNITLFTEGWKSPSESLGPLRDGLTDGALVLAPYTDSGILESLASLSLPTVAIAGEQRTGVSVVDVDSYRGVRLAMEHLLSLGHRRIGYLSSGVNVACYQPRLDGFTDALAAEGLKPAPELVQICCFNPQTAFEQTCVMLSLPDPPTAICAGNDTAALGVLEAARALHVSVPRQLSVVGFDDIPTASIVSPPLTTVRQPLQAIGEMAVGLLIEQIRNPSKPKPPQPILMAPELIVRASTAAPLGHSLLV